MMQTHLPEEEKHSINTLLCLGIWKQKENCSSLMEGTRYAGFFDPVLLLTRKRKLQATSPSSLIEKPKRGEST
jgi:hypothetical protein